MINEEIPQWICKMVEDTFTEVMHYVTQCLI